MRTYSAGGERKAITFGQLKKRGWPEALIYELLPNEGADWISCRGVNEAGFPFTTKCYRVQQVQELENWPDFERRRTQLARRVIPRSAKDL